MARIPVKEVPVETRSLDEAVQGIKDYLERSTRPLGWWIEKPVTNPSKQKRKSGLDLWFRGANYRDLPIVR